jgi:hypothetical protein
MKCKYCGFEMGLVAKFHLTSDDPDMTGDYCTRECIELERAKLK